MEEGASVVALISVATFSCLNRDLIVRAVLDDPSPWRAELGRQLSLTGADWLPASVGGKEPFHAFRRNGAIDPSEVIALIGQSSEERP